MEKENGSKEVEMAVEGSEEAGKDKSEEGGDEKSKLQAQKDKDLLTFEGIMDRAEIL